MLQQDQQKSYKLTPPPQIIFSFFFRGPPLVPVNLIPPNSSPPHPPPLRGATNYDRSLNSKLSITKIYAEQTFKPFDIFVPGTAKKNEQEKL